MSLVDYSASSSENESDLILDKDRPQRKKRKITEPHHSPAIAKAPPPLPLSFHSLYATATRTSTSDDPSLHAGRTRQIPHVIGHWPTHLYLEWHPSTTQEHVLQGLVDMAASAVNTHPSRDQGAIHSFLRSNLGAPLPLHISLSAPIVLHTDQKSPFQELIEAKVQHAQITSFQTHTLGLKWVSNKDKTRFFFVLILSRPENDQLNLLLEKCNAVARHFGLEPLYHIRQSHDPAISPSHRDSTDQTGSFHISIGWTLSEPSEQEKVHVSQAICPRLTITFSQLKLKIGNSITDIPLLPGETSC
ncbi:hypothetical protein B0A52_03694 [Exophiala mesophila]|uniref:U6 snRNA phosphodiesterase n=1 Tax=Exophiala mesophila TaxID=212818 RepID=A0A438NA61_EXOME|nr:hypothetical protein B0A52_03694 [Exophiala mesophila]